MFFFEFSAKLFEKLFIKEIIGLFFFEKCSIQNVLISKFFLCDKPSALGPVGCTLIIGTALIERKTLFAPSEYLQYIHTRYLARTDFVHVNCCYKYIPTFVFVKNFTNVKLCDVTFPPQPRFSRQTPLPRLKIAPIPPFTGDNDNHVDLDGREFSPYWMKLFALVGYDW